MSSTIAKRFAPVAAASMLIMGIAAQPANAQADDAQYACAAYNIGSTTASVPLKYQGSKFAQVVTRRGTFEVKCGNGATTGAVHIEMKHDVPDWPDALKCITKVINNGEQKTIENGKTQHLWTAVPSGPVIVIRGTAGIITAYPVGGGNIEQRWKDCASW